MDIDIDALLCMQEIIDGEVDLALMIEKTSGMPAVMSGVADIAWERAAGAQEQLDRMIDEDGTWH